MLIMKNKKAEFLHLPAYWMIPDRGGHWISDNYLDFKSAKLDCVISVHPGSVNNLSSIPWWMRKLINPNGPHRPAAALHDELYNLRGVTDGRTFSRKECDDLYLEAMLVERQNYIKALPKVAQNYMRDSNVIDQEWKERRLTKKWMAYVLYAGVRLFGWRYWK